MLTFHILNVYVDKTQPHQFKYTFKCTQSLRPFFAIRELKVFLWFGHGKKSNENIFQIFKGVFSPRMAAILDIKVTFSPRLFLV